MAASIALLDELHTPPAQPPHDQNDYSFGRIGYHNVVLVCLPAGVTGTTSAATVAAQLRSTFPSIQYGLLVGVGGGAPSPKCDIRLGDVVVSKPAGIFGGVVQYDFGKTIEKGTFKQTGSLNKPPRVLLNALARLETQCHLRGNYLTWDSLAIPDAYSQLHSAAKYPGAEFDQLYKAECDHGKDPESCGVCENPQQVDRPPRRQENPVIHFGLIASANQVMRHGVTREKLRKELDVMCFEMEAAGLMDSFPCLVIRGICDYADAHKTKQWQPYAAVTAAACAKQILLLTPINLEERVVVNANDIAPPTPWLAAFNSSCFQNLRNYRFSGRDAELALLDSWYSGGVDLAQGRNTQSRFVIHGLGGVGKTQLVTEWCHRLRDRSRASIFWFAAGSWDELMSKYQQQARRYRKLAAIDRNARTFLETHDVVGDDLVLVKALIQAHENWVIVLDNYDTISVDVEPFLPDSVGRVIVTSRDRRAIGPVSNRGFELKRPQSAEAELLFLRLSCPQKTTTAASVGEHPEYTAVKEIVSDLDGFPLAISQAAAYIRENQPFSCAEYLEILRLRPDREILLRFKEERPEYPESVMTTWEISLDYLKKKHPEAAELLQLLGFFARSGVAEGILKDSAGMKRWNVGSYISVRRLNSEQRDELYFLEPRARAGISLGILTSLSLVSQSSDKIVSVHPLVHEWIQARLKPNPRESTRFLRLCSLILYQAFPLEGIASSYMSHFTDVPTFTPHLLQLLDALEQAKQYSEPMPLELRTLLLAHLLFEARQENAYSPTDLLPLIVRVFPSDLSDTKEPVEGIQNRLFSELREVSSLWHATTLDRIMKVLRLGLSNYSSAPSWTFSRKVYMVALVTFVLEIVENWLLYTETASKLRSGFRNQQPHEPYYKTRKGTAGTLCTILRFLSLETGKVPEEISFLQVRVRLVLAQIITMGEYKKLRWHFFRDGISWERVACVDLSTAFEYFVACARFSRPYPKEMADALTFAARAFYKSQQPSNITADGSVPFFSNSFGRDFESYIPKALTIELVKASKVLTDVCFECCSVLLKDLKYRSPTSLTDERNIGSCLLSILEARDEARSGIRDITVGMGEGENLQLSALDKHVEFQCLYVHAHFLRAAYGEAILGFQKLFEAEKVMFWFSFQYKNPRHLLPDHKDDGNGEATATKTTLLSYIFRPFRRETLRYQVPIVDPSGVRHQESFNSSSEDLNIGEQAVAWYAQELQLEDLDVAKNLLRIWVDCVGHLKPIEGRDLETWRNRVDAIPRIYSPETITMVHTLAKASVEPWDQFGARSVRDAERRVRSESTSLRKSTKGDSPPAEVDGE